MNFILKKFFYCFKIPLQTRVSNSNRNVSWKSEPDRDSNVLMLFIPLPLFWALVFQLHLMWISQKSQLNENVATLEIKPFHMQLASSVLSLVLIPVFDIIIYPFLRIFWIRRPLQKMTLGAIFALISLVCSLELQYRIGNSPNHTLSVLWQLPQYVSLSIFMVKPNSVIDFEINFSHSSDNVRKYWL